MRCSENILRQNAMLKFAGGHSDEPRHDSREDRDPATEHATLSYSNTLHRPPRDPGVEPGLYVYLGTYPSCKR